MQWTMVVVWWLHCISVAEPSRWTTLDLEQPFFSDVQDFREMELPALLVLLLVQFPLRHFQQSELVHLCRCRYLHRGNVFELSLLHPASFWHPLPKCVQLITFPWKETTQWFGDFTASCNHLVTAELSDQLVIKSCQVKVSMMHHAWQNWWAVEEGRGGF